MQHEDIAAAAALAGLVLKPARVAAVAPLVRAMAAAGQALATLALTEPPSGPDSGP